MNMYEKITRHGENLNNIFNTGLDPVALCKKLHRLETKGNRIALNYCNGDIDTDEKEKQADKILKSVNKILGYTESNIPVFFNGDCRGYALKINDDYVREHNLTIDKDWGGYGLICPDYSEG